MIKRKIESEVKEFFSSNNNKALLITGARQVGKTYTIREYAKKHFDYFIEINFIENKETVKIFENAKNSDDILLRLSAITDVPMVKGKTLIFFDEVQECKEIVTAIKFLVDEGSYSYILSGSLLGVELKDIRSVPVGYMDIFEMYPLDFFEFCTATGVSEQVLGNLKDCFLNKTAVDTVVHEKMLALFNLYLVVGGMPAAVMTYIKTNNLKEVSEIQKGIIQLYKMDISKYDPNNKLYLEEIFELIPSELNNQNKRYVLKKLYEQFKLSRNEHSFIWLKEAGVALPVYCAQEPSSPLLLSKSTNLFKLFLSDVGLLAAMYMNGLQLKILNKETDVNFGSVWENAIAQELKAHGFDLYYYNSKKYGELDFLIEYRGEILPIEVKSGKAYKRHNALSSIMDAPNYNLKQAIVFCNENAKKCKNVFYCPIYMAGFLEREDTSALDYKYTLDIDVLKS